MRIRCARTWRAQMVAAPRGWYVAGVVCSVICRDHRHIHGVHQFWSCCLLSLDSATVQNCEVSWGPKCTSCVILTRVATCPAGENRPWFALCTGVAGLLDASGNAQEQGRYQWERHRCQKLFARVCSLRLGSSCRMSSWTSLILSGWA